MAGYQLFFGILLSLLPFALYLIKKLLKCYLLARLFMWIFFKVLRPLKIIKFNRSSRIALRATIKRHTKLDGNTGVILHLGGLDVLEAFAKYKGPVYKTCFFILSFLLECLPDSPETHQLSGRLWQQKQDMALFCHRLLSYMVSKGYVVNPCNSSTTRSYGETVPDIDPLTGDLTKDLPITIKGIDFAQESFFQSNPIIFGALVASIFGLVATLLENKGTAILDFFKTILDSIYIFFNS